MKMIKILFLLLLSLFLFLFFGCSHARNRESELAAVAKDWCLVIRASQVIPIYPLSEDLQPGDILLVRTPIDKQVDEYKDDGFLPLDQLMHRLNPDMYCEFYNSRYGIEDDVIPPAFWQKTGRNNKHNWSQAPHAGFPAYHFSIDKDRGASIAIPIQGVPLALGIMNTDNASGTVNIENAYTYGLDNACLYKAVKRWAGQNRSVLLPYQPKKINRSYLRVVSRVFLADALCVALYNNSSSDIDASISIPKVEEPANINILTKTQRSVTMKESFEKPLVIGYVGFDIPIMKGGLIGNPVSTLDRLTERHHEEAEYSSRDYTYNFSALNMIYLGLTNDNDSDAVDIVDRLDSFVYVLPNKYPFTCYMKNGDGILELRNISLKRKEFLDVTSFGGYALSTINAIEDYLSANKAKDEEEKIRLEENLRQAKTALTELNENLNNPILIEAVNYYLFSQ